TPYEAAFGKKPDLSQVCKWGKKVWVWIESGDKLGGCVREGRWIGVNERSSGCHVYWADKLTVTTEHNIYFDKTHASVERLKGEDWDFVELSPDPLTLAPSTSNNPSLVSTSTAPPPAPVQPEAPPEDEAPARRIRKPSQHIQDILSGRGVTSAQPSDPQLSSGIQLPTAEFEGEGIADWKMAAFLTAADFAEYAMAAETSNVEALEPWSLAEAKRCPDW
ncbi:hypothetical protein L208DRAFT_1137823, partial [Tricholoma matsutake]